MRKKILLGISVIFAFFILLFSSLFSQLYNLNYYDKKYEQYNVYDRFSKEEALDATKNIFDFFNSKAELDNEFFNENEISHLQDVKVLINKAKQLYYISITLFWIILLTVYLSNKKHFTKFFFNFLFYSGLFSITLILLLGLLYFITGFDFMFIKFHELFFTSNYSFNPAINNMKALFPDEFFRDLGISIILSTLIKSLLLTATGYILNKRKIY